MRPTEPVDVPVGDIDRLAAFIDDHERLLVLTGAGVSTSSGIPAYRDDSGQWLQRRPILYQEFLRCADTRRRYWARSFFRMADHGRGDASTPRTRRWSR